jgi:excisionase family DNA binding protein
MESLGISKQRLMYFIRQGVIEREEHIGPSGRFSVMVRRDQLDLARAEVNGKIDMKAAGAMLGLSKTRMRQMLLMLFPDAKKMATAASVPWSISRESVENLLNVSTGIETVSIPDEECVSVQHIFRYWAWTARELVELINAARKGEIEILNLLDYGVGLNAWIFSERDLKLWRAKTIQGYGNWLSVDQVAKLLNIKQQTAYQLVGKHFIHGDVLHHQPKGGVRVKRSEVDRFRATYIFCTEISQKIGVSPKKAKSILLEGFYIKPVSGPGIDDGRQLLYLRTDSLDNVLESIVSRKDTKFSLI